MQTGSFEKLGGAKNNSTTGEERARRQTSGSNEQAIKNIQNPEKDQGCLLTRLVGENTPESSGTGQ